MFRIYVFARKFAHTFLKTLSSSNFISHCYKFVFLGSLLIQFLFFSAYLALAKNNSAWGKYQQVPSVKA